MKTIMSRHFPPLPIAINYNIRYRSIPGMSNLKDIRRLLCALKCPDRIRGIDLYASTTNGELDLFFEATKCPFPALESLALYNSENRVL